MSLVTELFLSSGRNLQMFDDCGDITEKALNFPARLGQILIICQPEISASRKERMSWGGSSKRLRDRYSISGAR